MPLAEPLPASAVHVVVDMQRVFAEETAWHTPGLDAILPAILRLVEHRPERTFFARFLVPARAADAPGRWQHYYERWPELTGERMDEALLDLVAPLARLAAAGRIIDKTTYSIFTPTETDGRLRAVGADTLVFSGVETDVCVLASVIDAIERGFRVVVATDALASAAEASHDRTLAHLATRLPEQIELATSSEIVRSWPRKDEA
ncbi:cysteine hydrolase family protein [Jiella avicenniae]|uniref:Cysteine hydrolase n=1 Tax=Jiella avicenniae TaxID=2907202 RepID=A0A9X1P545_9HYPH|nr:isochorismatase family cysteine hydrolase [Jiella avicenniae]MCE7029984.1 cysteine hydrolase [Jiella avicenniae]